MVEIPKLPTKKCGFGRVPVAVFAYHTVMGFPIPISGVDIRFLGVDTWGRDVYGKTNTVGLAEECNMYLKFSQVFAKKDGIDFGAGKGKWAEVGKSLALASPKVFPTKAKILCSDMSFSPPSIAASNFKFGTIPNITVLPVNVFTPAGSFTIKSGRYVFSLNNVKIAEGSIPESGKIDHNLPDLRDISGIKGLLGTSVELKVEITAGDCTYTGTRSVSLPALAVPCYGELGLNLEKIKDELSRFAKLPTSLNVPVFITNARGTIETTEIDVYVGDRLVGTTAAGRSIDLITVLKGRVADLGKVNQITLKPKSKCIEARTFDIPALIPTGIAPPALPCTVWETRANVTMPKILQYPFSTYLSGAKWICRDTGISIPVDGVDAEVYIGSMRFAIPVRSGSGTLALKAEEIKSLIAARAETIAPAIEAPARVTAECDKKGEVEGAAELQAWLSICYVGGGYRVEGGPPLFKIVRRDGSHFWGKRYQDIAAVLRSNP